MERTLKENRTIKILRIRVQADMQIVFFIADFSPFLFDQFIHEKSKGYSNGRTALETHLTKSPRLFATFINCLLFWI